MVVPREHLALGVRGRREWRFFEHVYALILDPVAHAGRLALMW